MRFQLSPVRYLMRPLVIINVLVIVYLTYKYFWVYKPLHQHRIAQQAVEQLSPPITSRPYVEEKCTPTNQTNQRGRRVEGLFDTYSCR